MRLRCSGAMPLPESATSAATCCPLASVATRRRPPPGMASLAFSSRLRKTCCSLPGLPWMGAVLGQIEIDDDLRGLELVFEQRERVADDLVQVGVAELGGRGAGEIQQAVGDLGGAEALLGDLVQHRAQARIALQLLGEHLRVGGDDGQRRVDLMGHAGGQQADGAELVGLRQLGFQRNALGDVVHQDDAAHGDKIPREQRRDGDVGGALLAGAGGQRELVEVMHALLVAEAVQRLDELRGEDGRSAWPMASARLRAYMASICAFQLSMRSSRSRARMPTLIDSTMFSLNSLSRSNSPIFSSRRA
jgi:hypothetical protein